MANKKDPTLKKLEKMEARYLRDLRQQAARAERAAIRNAGIYNGETFSELLRAATWDMLEDYEEISDDAYEDLDEMIAGLEDEIAAESGRKTLDAWKAEEKEKNKGSGIDILAAAVFLSFGALYVRQSAAMARHLEKVAQLGIEKQEKEEREKQKEKEAQEKAIFDRDKDLIERLVSRPWMDNEGFADRMVRHMGKRRVEVLREIAQGLARGDKYDAIVKRVAGKVKKESEKDVYKLVYTEGTHALNEAAAQKWERSGYGYYIYQSVGDSRVCDKCADLDGQQFKLEERLDGVNFPPLHTGCRCGFTICDKEENEA